MESTIEDRLEAIEDVIGQMLEARPLLDEYTVRATEARIRREHGITCGCDVCRP